MELVPYLPEQAIPYLQKFEQLILVGALLLVTTFAYKGKPVIKVPSTCQVTTLATVDHALLTALEDLAKAVGASSKTIARRVRSAVVQPTGDLTADAISKSICALLPENAILLDEGGTNGIQICEEKVVSRPGLEPGTRRLRVSCSTIELAARLNRSSKRWYFFSFKAVSLNSN